MSEMIERVVRVLAENEGEQITEIARAVITVLREPTEAMMREGFKNNRHRNTMSCGKPQCVGAITLPPDKAWRAMIDEALR